MCAPKTAGAGAAGGAADQDAFLRPLLEALLQRMMDSHKKVQEAACSAFSSVAENAGVRLVPYLEGVCQVWGDVVVLGASGCERECGWVNAAVRVAEIIKRHPKQETTITTIRLPPTIQA
jgi:hypothetical protein